VLCVDVRVQAYTTLYISNVVLEASPWPQDLGFVLGTCGFELEGLGLDLESSDNFWHHPQTQGPTTTAEVKSYNNKLIII